MTLCKVLFFFFHYYQWKTSRIVSHWSRPSHLLVLLSHPTLLVKISSRKWRSKEALEGAETLDEETGFSRLTGSKVYNGVTCDWHARQFCLLFADRLNAAGKWSGPQCHGQVGLHSPAQSIGQGQLPSHPAASQAECLNEHPGLAGQHGAVRVQTHLSKIVTAGVDLNV